ncbi:MAG: D-2-hydroxyacid dehydrogenase [Oscillospiraceae bacterium]|nr:D-2-hydroxyacid dehydrogenase [Oscillospiraceae bacterium]
MEKKKGLVLFPCDGGTRERLIRETEGLCDFVFREEGWTAERYREALGEAHIIIGEPKNGDFQYCRHLELMHSPSSGVNYYVEGGQFPKGATLCCMTGGYGNVLAEHMLAMALSLCRRLPEYRDQQHDHKWELRKFDKQLEGSTVMILGAGDIGTTLARWMRPMVGKIIGVRRVAREFPDCYDEMLTLEQLDGRLGEADIILCALPHTPETVGLLNEKRLRSMKKDAVLVNGGRGSLIDQEALCRLLREGWFWGVGLEVTSPEPLPEAHPLWDIPRVIITPHAAGNSFGPGSPLERKIWEFIIPNVARFLRGETPENKVDFATGYRETK